MLKDVFYKVTNVETQEDSSLFTIRLNPGHSIYNGHFPGNPIVPGVCSLQIIKECVESICGINKLIYSRIDQCKYVHAIQPNREEVFSVSIKIREHTENGISVSATIFDDDTIFVVLKSILKQQTTI